MSYDPSCCGASFGYDTTTAPAAMAMTAMAIPANEVRGTCMMGEYQMNLFFECHATSLDNESGLASGHFDVALSEPGRQQAREMGDRYRDRNRLVIYTSDLKRATETGALAFEQPAISDSRLRECDYGTWTRCKVEQMEAGRLDFVDKPFPEGESYRDVVTRVREFLADLPRDTRDTLIIGHRATWYSLEHLLCGRDLRDVIAAPWKWQPGWFYQI
jgi:broad specificity phosphatase PhoE